MRDDPDLIALVMRARGGDKAAWQAIVERFAPFLWARCKLHRLTNVDAQDVTQEVWLRLAQHINTLREPAALPGWLRTTTDRACEDFLRKRPGESPLVDDVVIDDASDEWLLAQERYIALRAGFAELPERCRSLLTLLYSDPRLHYAEISTKLAIPRGSIGPCKERCLQKLRRTKALARFLGPTEK